MVQPIDIVDWYGGRHTCHSASGANGNILVLRDAITYVDAKISAWTAR